MVKRDNKWRWRRVLLLALLLLIPTLLSDLPLFSKMGHGHGGGAAAGQPGASAGGATLALLPVEPGALGLGHGRKHRHVAPGLDVDDGQDALLHNLVYTHDTETGDDNKPLSDGVGDPGFSFGGDGGGHPGGGGGGGPFGAGGPGFDPGTEFLPLSIKDPSGPDDGPTDKGSDPPFFSPTSPSIAAVPEPATWALFILGFGFIGAQLRRARDARLVPALTRARKKRLG